MNWVAGVRTISVLMMVIGALAGLFAVTETALESPIAPRFLACCLINGAGGAVLWLIALGRTTRAGIREGVGALVLLWAGAPVFASLPFLNGLGVADMVLAYFHATSALTTTGYPPSGEILAAPSLVLWWNLLQWLGGLSVLFAAIVVLAGLNITGAGVHRTALLTHDADAIFSRLPVVGPPLLLAYALATVAAFGLILLGGAAPDQAMVMAMAGLSTGGLAFFDGQTTVVIGAGAGAVPLAALFGASVALVLGATSLVLPYRTLTAQANRLWDGELILFAGLCVAAMAASWPIDAPGTIVEWARGGIEALALVSTAGWDAGLGGVRSLPMPMTLILIIIGGGAVSTAGGVKLRRVLLMSRQLGSELQRLAQPSGVRERDRRAVREGGDVAVSVGIYFFAFGAAATMMMLAFALTGLSFQASAAAAVTTLVNAGPTFEPAVRDASIGLTDTLARQMVACVGMIVGRMEVIAAFVVLAPVFWRR